MDTIQLPPDFKEFLRLLNSTGVRYLVVGGYAVGFHGHPRTTGDMDIWADTARDNAQKLYDLLVEFGFRDSKLSPELLATVHRVVRMGYPPVRIEILTSISGVEFSECYARRAWGKLDDTEASVISLQDLLTNKKAAARHRDIEDVERLESMVKPRLRKKIRQKSSD